MSDAATLRRCSVYGNALASLRRAPCTSPLKRFLRFAKTRRRCCCRFVDRFFDVGRCRESLKFKREPSRRLSQTRRIHNASGGCPKKIEIQTHISAKTFAHAPHSLCKRWRPEQNLNSNASQPEDGHTRAAFKMQALAAHKIETKPRMSPKTVAHAPHSQCKRWRPQQN